MDTQYLALLLVVILIVHAQNNIVISIVETDLVRAYDGTI